MGSPLKWKRWTLRKNTSAIECRRCTDKENTSGIAPNRRQMAECLGDSFCSEEILHASVFFRQNSAVSLDIRRVYRYSSIVSVYILVHYDVFAAHRAGAEGGNTSFTIFSKKWGRINEQRTHSSVESGYGIR